MNKKVLLMIVLLVTLLVNLAAPTKAYAAIGNDSFNPNVSYDVLTTALQSTGKILVGGSFTQISSTSRNYIGRLNPDGTLDSTFNPSADDYIRTIVVQPDDKILVGGDFSNIAGAARYNLARLTGEGVLDSSFSNVRTDDSVYVIALQADGKIILAGTFTQILVGSTLYDRARIARLNANGTMDTSFNPGADQVIRALAVQTDGKILVGGDFRNLGGSAKNYIGRLNADGTLDTSFTASTDNRVNAITVHADGRIVIGGIFSKVNQISYEGIARLHPDGSLDSSVNHTFNSRNVSTIAIQPDGKIVLGGFFSTINGLARTKLARLNFDGTLDAGFSPSLGHSDKWVYTITIQPDGKILAGGTFTIVEGFVINRLARFYPDGSKESPVSPSLDYKVSAIAVQPNGSFLIGGDFTTVGGISHQGIALIRQTGFADHTFSASVTDPGFVNAIAVQADGKILVGGSFTTMNYQTMHHIGRLNADGSLDNTFFGDINGPVYAIALQKDGKILIGGNFTYVGKTLRRYVARLNTDGSLDTSFETNVLNVVRTIALQEGGKILIGGDFESVFDSVRYYLARLNPSGSLDTGFTANASDLVRSIVVQPDNKILVAGDFTSLLGQTTNRIGRLNANGTRDTSFVIGANAGANDNIYSMALQADGKIIIGGAFSQLHNSAVQRIGRLHSDGGLDTSFLPGNTNASVLALAIQSDGKVLAGGNFTLLDDVPCTYLSRIATQDSAFQQLNTDSGGTEIWWTIRGSGPNFQLVSFELSTNSVNYTHLGYATFIGDDNWFLTGSNLIPNSGNVFIRARGFASSGTGNGSASITESILNVYYPNGSTPLDHHIYVPLIIK